MAYALLSYHNNMMHCPGKLRYSCIIELSATAFSLVFRLMVTATKTQLAFSILLPNSDDGKRSQRDKESGWRLLASVSLWSSQAGSEGEAAAKRAARHCAVVRWPPLAKREGSIASAFEVALSLTASKRTLNLFSHRCHPTNVFNFWHNHGAITARQLLPQNTVLDSPIHSSQ